MSAAVGFGIPERWIFRFGILFMSGERLLAGAVAYAFPISVFFLELINQFSYNWFRRELPPQHYYTWMNRIHFWAHTLENLALFGLTYVTSSEYYEVRMNISLRSLQQLDSREMLHFLGAFPVDQIRCAHVLIQGLPTFEAAYQVSFSQVARGPAFNARDAYLWKLKKMFITIDILMFIGDFVTFILHNMYCWPYCADSFFSQRKMVSECC